MAGNRGGRRRTLAQMDKDAKTLALHIQGKSHAEIIVIQEYKSTSSVTGAIKRAIADRQKDAFAGAEDFALAVARIQRTIAYHEQVMATRHYAVSTTGKVVTDPETGLPMLDPGPGQRSAAELRHLYAELAKLQGTYAPTKVRQEVIEQSTVDAQIQAELQEIQRLASAGEAPGPGVVREP